MSTLRPGRELFERESELELIEAHLQVACSGSGGVLVVRGPAGVGKTELLRAACGRARELEVRVVSVRGTELERDLPYGLVRQLADAVLAGEDEAGRADLLAGPTKAAVAQVLEAAESVAPEGDPALLIPHGLFWLVAHLAARGPVLVSVDDGHWCDPESARFLAYLAPRVDGLPVLLAVAARWEQTGVGPAWATGATAMIEPAALSERTVARLVRAGLSRRADREFCDACHAATGGNPFFVHQLVEALAAQGFSGAATEVGRVRELGPKTVADAVLVRLARLPEPALALARAAAVLGEQADHRHLLALAELDQTTAAHAIRALVGAGVIEDARPVRFVHPIVRNAIYQDLGATERARAHRQAAAQLIAERAAPELVAAQLVLSDPGGDAAVVDALRQAGVEALARGAPDATVRWLTRALVEPPPVHARAQVLFELGSAEALTRDHRAIDHLSAAVAAFEEPQARAKAARLLARLLMISARWPEAVALMDREVRSVERIDPELAVALANDWAFVTRHTPAPIEGRRDGVEVVRRLVGARLDHPRTPAERVAVTILAVDATSLCEPADKVVAMIELALGGGSLLAEEISDSPVFLVAGQVLMYADRLDAAYEHFSAGIEDARARGSLSGFVANCCFRAHTAFRQGRVLAAEADARASLETDGPPLPHFLPTQVAALIDPLLARGQLQAAANELAKHDLDGALSDDYHAAFLLDSRARVRLAQGRADDALADALDAGRRQQAEQIPNPAMVPWGSTAALAAAAVGDHRRAQEHAEQELQLARTFGAPRAVGIALRAYALASSTPQQRIVRLREAVHVLENSPARLDYARALIELGAALRRDQQRAAAREPLRLALDIALASGANALATSAREELAATGAKPRHARVTGPTALTPSERRIARMAAEGMTNNQIAQALFLVPRTVEMHLTSVYRKLAIDSRTQLAEALRSTSPTT